MGSRGPTKKPDETRQRRNAVVPQTELQLGSTPVSAPALPNAKKYLKATRDWYAEWSVSQQASQFTNMAWQRLHMLAKIVDAYYRTTDPVTAKTLLGEIRLNEKELGATPEAMQRLRWIKSTGQGGATEAEATGTDGAAVAKPAAPKRTRGVDPRLSLIEGGKGKGGKK